MPQTPPPTETLERSLSVISENCRRLRTAEQLLAPSRLT